MSPIYLTRHICSRASYISLGISRNVNCLFKPPGSLRPLCVHLSTSFVQCQKKTDSEEIEVYTGPLTKQIRGVKVFSLMTSISGIFAQPVILERAQQLEATLPTIVGLCSVVGFFTFVTPLLLHFVTKKYVTSVSYNSNTNTYDATTYSFFVRKKHLTFKPGDAIVPDIPGMFTSITIRGVPLFIDSRYFDDINHYKKIMGYDKPMDFKLKQL